MSVADRLPGYGAERALTVTAMDYNAYFLDLLRRLVETPSVSQDEETCAELLAEILERDLGMEVEQERLEGKSVNVYGRWHGSSCRNAGIKLAASGKKECPEKMLLLGGHIDVVAPGEGWQTAPFKLTIIGDRAYGRGTFDMKGGLAAQIAVLKKLRDEGWEPEGRVELVGLCDEERLSIGANAYAKRVRKENAGNAFGIFAEPHYDSIVVGATGKVLLGLSVSGASGHAAEPETGINAISCLAKLVAAVDEKYTPLYECGNVASHSFLKIASRWEGYSLNIPDEAEALLNKQLFLGEEIEVFLADLQAIYTREVGHGQLTIEKLAPYYPSYHLPEEMPGLILLRKILKDRFRHEPMLCINQSVSDANVIYPTAGLPTILFGPDGADLHKPNEYILLSSAYKYMKMLEEFMKTYF